jgi:hypothetical protein
MEKKLIKLSNCDDFAIIDQEDEEKISRYRWYRSFTGSGNPQIRASALGKLATQNKKVLIHRIIMDCPQGMVVDHINGDIFDNRKSNLRICTNKENSRNQIKRKIGSSKYKGVYFHRKANSPNKWIARLVHDGKLVYCGNFYTEYAAGMAWDMAAKSYQGEFARCNILSNGGW